jgi:hypothetical protein
MDMAFQTPRRTSEIGSKGEFFFLCRESAIFQVIIDVAVIITD